MSELHCKIHGNVDALECKEPDGQVHFACPYCEYEKMLDRLTAEFLKAYHSTPVKKMMEELHTFLCKTIFLPFGHNEHYVWLLMVVEQQKDSEAQDLHPVMYGMISTAFDKLLADMKRKRMAQD